MSLYTVVREPMEHGRVKFSVGWMGTLRSESKNEMSITLSQDGCMSVVVEKEYFYPGESEAFIEAILLARKEHETKIVAARKKWDHENGGSHDHFGAKVELSINETIAVLKTSPIDAGKILYENEWLKLCRTDLKDDVRICLDTFDREALQSMVRYGTRIAEGSFCIITSFSDG